MPIFEDVIFPLWNHLFLCYPYHDNFKNALVVKIGPILVVGPYDEKYIFFQKLFLIAQKKHLDVLKATQKKLNLLTKYGF